MLFIEKKNKTSDLHFHKFSVTPKLQRNRIRFVVYKSQNSLCRFGMWQKIQTFE